jgi:hypothetical protein
MVPREFGGMEAMTKAWWLRSKPWKRRSGGAFYRGLLKRGAGVWSPQQIRESAVLEHVLAHMKGAERGLARLEAARARLAPKTVEKIIVSLNAQPAKVEDLQTLHGLVVALEKEVEARRNRECPPQ